MIYPYETKTSNKGLTFMYYIVDDTAAIKDEYIEIKFQYIHEIVKSPELLRGFLACCYKLKIRKNTNEYYSKILTLLEYLNVQENSEFINFFLKIDRKVMINLFRFKNPNNLKAKIKELI